ncbi:MAG: hypothetical protein AAF639_40395 [Chloroflexota bacterium]
MKPINTHVQTTKIALFCGQERRYLRTLQQAIRANVLSVDIPIVVTPVAISPSSSDSISTPPKPPKSKKKHSPQPVSSQPVSSQLVSSQPVSSTTYLSLAPVMNEQSVHETTALITTLAEHELDWIIFTDWQTQYPDLPAMLAPLLTHYPYRILRVHPASPNLAFHTSDKQTTQDDHASNAVDGLGTDFGTDSGADSGTNPDSDPITDALTAFQENRIQKTGATIYMLTTDIQDSGIVLDTKDALIYKQDTPATLENRIHQAGEQVLVSALQRLIDGDEDW